MPKQHRIHVAIGSTTSKLGDVRGNLRQIAAFARQAAADGADLLLTPEMSASGYGPYPEVLATAEPAGDGPIYRKLAALATSTGVVLMAGFVEAADTKRHLAHYAVFPDGRYVVQRKNRVTLCERPLDPSGELMPPDYKNNPPKDPADPGQPVNPQFTYFDIKGVRCAISICADGGITQLSEILSQAGVRLLLGPAGAGGVRKDRVTTEDLRTADGRALYLKVLQGVFFPGGGILDCIQYRRALAAVNMCGWDGRRHYHVGHGMIISPMGEVPGFFHGIPNLDRQRPMYAHAALNLDECLPP